jgi:hypothetical protein
MNQIGSFVIAIAGLLWWSGVPAVLALSPSPSAGNALLISDLHFDPLADPDIVKKLIEAPVSDWESIFSSSKQAGYARTPNDANYPLIKIRAFCGCRAEFGRFRCRDRGLSTAQF